MIGRPDPWINCTTLPYASSVPATVAPFTDEIRSPTRGTLRPSGADITLGSMRGSAVLDSMPIPSLEVSNTTSYGSLFCSRLLLHLLKVPVKMIQTLRQGFLLQHRVSTCAETQQQRPFRVPLDQLYGALLSINSETPSSTRLPATLKSKSPTAGFSMPLPLLFTIAMNFHRQDLTAD